MKKLVWMAAAIIAVSFASCGNKAADAVKAEADSVRIADSLAAIKEAELATEAATLDSVDSVVVAIVDSVVAE